jgi:DNA-binding transcriptional regulator YiaG
MCTVTGDELKRLRERTRGDGPDGQMTQAQLAKLLGVHSVTVAKWEADTHKISKRTELAIRAILKG